MSNTERRAPATRPRISKVALRNFRAFPGDEEYIIDLKSEGKNLLLYGENGAGKSSLYIALQQLYAKGIYRPRYDFHDHLNIHTRDNAGHVEVTTTGGDMGPFRWTKHGMHPHVPGEIGDIGRSMPGQQEGARTSSLAPTSYQDFAKGVYLLDYKTLLRCSFPFEHKDRMDIADVLRLALYDYELDGERVAKHWHRLRLAQMKLHEDLGKAVDEFPRDLIEVSNDLGSRAFTFWVQFEHAITQWDSPFLVRANAIVSTLLQEDVAIEFRTIRKPRPDYAPPYVDLMKRNFELFIRYRSEQIMHPGAFLNEARMSALALSLFLSAAELCTASSPSGTRVLVLDDILISLDMSHRIPVLKLLQQEFSDWQILLFTHDRVWYELAWAYVGRDETGQADWVRKELITLDGGVRLPPRPYIKDGEDHLERAATLLNGTERDLMAAAVHIRAFFEEQVREKCEAYRVKVSFLNNVREHLTANLWTSLSGNKTCQSAYQKMGRDLIAKVNMVRNRVLNELSHAGPVQLVRSEVEEAIQIMRDFKTALD